MEGSDCSLIYGIIPVFAWGDWGRPQEVSARIVIAPAEIRTKHLPNVVRIFTTWVNLLDQTVQSYSWTNRFDLFCILFCYGINT
jgi:hypothetical protein